MNVYPTLETYLKRLDLSGLSGSKPDRPPFTELVRQLQWTEEIAVASGNPEILLRLLGVRSGDYVVLPNLCPPYWAAATKAIGADTILIDHHPQNWQLDLDLLEEFLMNFSMLNERDELILKKDTRVVRALIVPHLLGGLCDLERLDFIARRFHLAWGEDISQALGSSWNQKPAGTFGQLSYCDFARNPVLPFGNPALFSADPAQGSRLPVDPTPEGPAAELAERLSHQFLAEVPSILKGLQKVETAYRQHPLLATAKWMAVTEACRTNGLAAAFIPATPAIAEVNGLGRLPLPLYRQSPFDKSLYIRREDWSQKLYESAMVLPVFLEDLTRVEETIQRIAP